MDYHETIQILKNDAMLFHKVKKGASLDSFVPIPEIHPILENQFPENENME